jgi:hypothetical protein
LLPLNYVENESITHCSCGFELSRSLAPSVTNKDIEFTQKLIHDDVSHCNPLFQHSSLSQRFASLLWYQKRYSKQDDFSLSQVVDYFNEWPEIFYKELDFLTENAPMKLVDLFNRTLFRSIYGEVISSVPYLSLYEEQPHFIRTALMDYLTNLVERNPKSKKTNVADMLVSVSEAAIILGTSHEQVYRMYQDGILRSVFRQKMHQRINSQAGAFFLREVIEYKSSFGGGQQRMFLSAW